MIGLIWAFSKFACSSEEKTVVTEDKVEPIAYDFSVHKQDRISISEQLAKVDSENAVDPTVHLSLIRHGLDYKLDSLESALKKEVEANKITPREAGMITNNYIKQLFK